jgi:dihydrofolate synthase/folylpolyglutamate synthase
MRDFAAAAEARFFASVAEFNNLEKGPVRLYSPEEYSLARMEPLAELAGHPERSLRVLHVAGTKGKGSTCYFLAALLASAGHRTGVFTSPHVATVRERFQIDGRLISYAELQACTDDFCAQVRSAGLHPSLFEIMTLVSLRLFAANGCEFAILETGIGGMLDSTNYVRHPEACAITAISFDHMELLGDTIAAIASQKAGIIKPGVPVVVGRQPFPEAEQVLRQWADSFSAPLLAAAPPAVAEAWLPAATPPFLKENFGIAWRLCEAIGVVPCRERFSLPELRARCEQVSAQPLVILDAAHNRDSARRLAEALQTLHPARRFCIVLGVVPGKDTAGIVEELAPLAARFLLTDPQTTKGSALNELKSLIAATGIPWSISQTIAATDFSSAESVLFTGSFYTAVIGEALFSARR